MDVYMGLIFPSVIQFAPINTDNCYGQTYNVGANSALFSLLGTTFGGNGSSTFGLPDLRGRVPVGIGFGGPVGLNLAMGATGGTINTTLLTSNVPLAPHTHPATFAATTGASPINITVGSGGTGLNASVAAANVNGTLTVSTAAGTVSTPAANALPASIPQIPINGAGGGPKPVFAYGTATAPSTANWAVGGTTAAQSAPVNGTISGNANMVTGGTVIVGANTATPAAAAVSLMQPYLAINYLIITQGLYPTRP